MCTLVDDKGAARLGHLDSTTQVLQAYLFWKLVLSVCIAFSVLHLLECRTIDQVDRKFDFNRVKISSTILGTTESLYVIEYKPNESLREKNRVGNKLIVTKPQENGKKD